jgi:hypothetical protein
VGEAGKIFHWNGSVYQRLIAPTYDGKDFYAVWGSSKDDVWIAGKDNAIVHCAVCVGLSDGRKI